MVSKSRRRREARERAGARKKGQARRKPAGTMNSPSLRQTGVDVIGVAVIDKNARVGTGLLRFPINPRSLTGTRLGDYAQLWSRWRPLSLRLEVAPAAGMMVPGGYIAAWSANPDEEAPAGESAVGHLAALVTQIQRPIGQSAMLSIPCSATARWYTFSGSGVDIAHGSVLSVITGAVGLTGEVTVTFKLHWTIEFNGPDIPRPVEEFYIEPSPDYAGIFTDSVSDWADGAKLTFKHSEGGSVVPWPGVRSQVVYTVTQGVKILYVKSDGSTGEVKYFSRIIDSDVYSSALCCHATAADAAAYQKTGDLTKVLAYKAASDWATPQLPRLKGSPVTVSFKLDRALAQPAKPPADESPPQAIDYDLLALKVAALLRAPTRGDVTTSEGFILPGEV